MRSFPIVMTVTAYSAPLTIRTIPINNKGCRLRTFEPQMRSDLSCSA
jgi:hypothetical protein